MTIIQWHCEKYKERSKVVFSCDIFEGFLGGMPELDGLVLRCSDEAIGVFVEGRDGVDGLRVREDAREDLDLIVLGVANLDLSVLGAGVEERVRGRA